MKWTCGATPNTRTSGYTINLIGWIAERYSIVIGDTKKNRLASTFWRGRLSESLADSEQRVLFWDAINTAVVDTDRELSDIYEPQVWRDEPELGSACYFIITGADVYDQAIRARQTPRNEFLRADLDSLNDDK